MGIVIFVVILLIVSAVAIVAVSLYKAGKFNPDTKEESPEEEIKTYPIILRAISNNTMISANYILEEEGREVQSGKLSTGIPEVYPNAKDDFNYTLTVFGHDIYSNETICWMKGQEDCVITVDRIAEVKMVASSRALNVYVSQDLLRKPILCIAWSYKTVNVELSDMIETYAPKRMKEKVDVCYAITQKDIYALRSRTIFNDMDWDLNTLKLDMYKVQVGKYETNISLEYSPNQENPSIIWKTSVLGIDIPEETKQSVNESVIEFYHILEGNRDIRYDISIPVTAKSDEGQVRFILIDQGDSDLLIPTYGENEKYGLPDVQETFIYD